MVWLASFHEHMLPKSLYISPTVSNFMEQKLRFELVLGRLAVLKKMANYEQFFGSIMLCFHGKIFYHFFSIKYCSVRTKKVA